MSVTMRRLLGVAAASLALGLLATHAPAAADTARGEDGGSPVSPGVGPCSPSELSLREAGRSMSGPTPGTVFALRNRGSASCTITNGLSVRLYAADGNPVPLRFGPHETILIVLTLAPGEEASFTLGFAPQEPVACATATRIDVVLPGRPGTIEASTAIAVCGAGATATLSRVRPGLPARSSAPFG